MLTCSSDLKFSKLGVGNSCVREKGERHRSQSMGVLSRSVELLWWKEKNMKVSGFKLAGVKRNTYNDHGNKKNQVVSLEAACSVLTLQHVHHISLGYTQGIF
jgi:metal-dependent HD superfamily phosphatase/phosphodiesterase